MESHQKISMPNYQKLKTMVKRSIDQKLRLRNFDARNKNIETGEVFTSRGGLSGIQGRRGLCYQWKVRKWNLLSVERKRVVFERRPKKFPAREWRSCKTDTKNRAILWATNTKRWKCVEKKKRPRQKPVWEVQPTAVQKLLERYLHQISLWLLPSSRCQFYESDSGCKFCGKCSFPHWKVEEQPN